MAVVQHEAVENPEEKEKINKQQKMHPEVVFKRRAKAMVSLAIFAFA